MGTVTGIERIGKASVIYVDGVRFARLGEAAFDAAPCEVGEEIDEAAYADRIASFEFPRALDAAVRALEARDMTREALRRLLIRKDFLPACAEAAVLRLAEGGAVDDARFAERFVERSREAGLGAAAIRAKLRERGVPRELADEALTAIGEAEQSEAAAAQARAYARRYEGLPPAAARDRILRALIRRGFSWDVASAAAAGAAGEGDGDDWD